MHTHPKPIHSKPPVPEDTLFEYLKNNFEQLKFHYASDANCIQLLNIDILRQLFDKSSDHTVPIDTSTLDLLSALEINNSIFNSSFSVTESYEINGVLKYKKIIYYVHHDELVHDNNSFTLIQYPNLEKALESTIPERLLRILIHHNNRKCRKLQEY